MDLACPRCGYDLRGLADGRCPECGTAFTAAGLVDAGRRRVPWLFEHAVGRRRLAAFWATYRRTAFPRRFWRAVTPDRPVRPRAVLLYWLATVVLLAVVVVGPLVAQGVTTARQDHAVRMLFRPMPGRPGVFYDPWTYNGGPSTMTAAELDQLCPSVASVAFARDVTDAYLQRTGGAFVAVAVVTAAWPWLTMLGLLPFRTSLRRAGAEGPHVLRAAVYGCDFGLLMAVVAVAAYGLLPRTPFPARPRGVEIVELAALLAIVTAAACGVVATYRMTVAAGRHLRVRWPLAVVVVSQVIAFGLVELAAGKAAGRW